MKNLSLILASVLFAVSVNAQLSGDEPVLPQEPVAEEPAPLDPPAHEEPPVLEPPSEEPPVLEPPKPEPLPIVIGEAGYGGTGCTAGNALIGHDDQGRITVLLAPMIVSGNNSSAFARAACSVRVPITVPANHKLAIVEVLNRGLYTVEASDSLVLTQESGFVGSDKVPQTLNLPSDGDGELHWDSSVGQLNESSCEKTENILSLNTSALLRKQKAGATTSLVALESIEVQLMLEPCQN